MPIVTITWLHPACSDLAPYMAFPSSHHVYRAPNLQMPVHTKWSDFPGRVCPRPHSLHTLFSPLHWSIFDCQCVLMCTVNREIFMLKIICVKNFHGKFSQLCSIRKNLMVDDCNMDKHLEIYWCLVYCQVSEESGIADCSRWSATCSMAMCVYCCVVMVLLLKCSLSPDCWNFITCCLSEWASSSGRAPDRSKGRYQPSASSKLFIYYIQLF